MAHFMTHDLQEANKQLAETHDECAELCTECAKLSDECARLSKLNQVTVCTVMYAMFMFVHLLV